MSNDDCPLHGEARPPRRLRQVTESDMDSFRLVLDRYSRSRLTPVQMDTIRTYLRLFILGR